MTQRRIYLQEYAYHITFNTKERSPIFENVKMARILHEVIIGGGKRKGFDIIAFSILPDHVHLLVKKQKLVHSSRPDTSPTPRLTSPTPRLTAAAMNKTKRNEAAMDKFKKHSAGAATRAVNTYSDLLYYIKSFSFYRLRKECSFYFSPWQPRFNFRIVDSGRRFENTINYILNNYKKHGLSARHGQYPYAFH